MDRKQIGTLYGLPIYETDDVPECEISMEREAVRVPLGNFRYVDGVLTATIGTATHDCKIEINVAGKHG